MSNKFKEPDVYSFSLISGTTGMNKKRVELLFPQNSDNLGVSYERWVAFILRPVKLED